MHAGKEEQSPVFAVGRWWGFINRGEVLLGRNISEEGEISSWERIWWARLYRRSTGYKIRQAAGLGLPTERNPAAIGPMGMNWYLARSNHLTAHNFCSMAAAQGPWPW
jgi:hypothetical protein